MVTTNQKCITDIQKIKGKEKHNTEESHQITKRETKRSKEHIAKMSVIPRLIFRFNMIPTKISASYFVSIEKLILKCLRKGRRHRRVNTLLEEKNKVGELTLPDFKTCYNKATLIKTVLLVKD